MKKTKSFPVAVALMGLGAASSFAEIKINDNLSTSGFLDMSINGCSPERRRCDPERFVRSVRIGLHVQVRRHQRARGRQCNADCPDAAGSPIGDTASFSTPTSAVYLEQGFVNYTMGGFGVTAGRFLSSSGYEAAEPTGMFQYSYSKTLVYGYYQNGLALSYSTPMFGLYGAVVSDLWNPQEFELLNSAGFEGQITLTPVEGITAKVAYLYQIYDEDRHRRRIPVPAQCLGAVCQRTPHRRGGIQPADGLGHRGTTIDDASGMGWLGLVNYKITDKVATTFRYSAWSSRFDDVRRRTPKSPSAPATRSAATGWSLPKSSRSWIEGSHQLRSGKHLRVLMYWGAFLRVGASFSIRELP